MRPMVGQVFNRGFFVAVAVGLAVAILGMAAITVAGLPDVLSWAVLLIAMLAGSLADRKGFYGEPPHEPHL